MQGNPPPFLLLATAVAKIGSKSGAKTGLAVSDIILAGNRAHSASQRPTPLSLSLPVSCLAAQNLLALIFVYSGSSGEVPDAHEKDFSAHILAASVYGITDCDLTLALSQ